MDSHTLIQALTYLGAAALIAHRRPSGAGVSAGLSDRRLYYRPVGAAAGDRCRGDSALAEIGVVLMLFVIGLELDPQRLWKLRARCLAAAHYRWWPAGC